MEKLEYAGEGHDCHLPQNNKNMFQFQTNVIQIKIRDNTTLAKFFFCQQKAIVKISILKIKIMVF